jgi:uncharacterized protein
MIRSVSDDGIIIGETKYQSTVAITSDEVFDTWCDKAVTALQCDDFADVLATEPEIVILGTGQSNIFAPRELVFAFARRSVGLEVMDSKAAARTFNVLAGEGRKVAAVLYV